MPTRLRMTIANRVLKAFRVLHLYLGVFTAPALLFFAVTGGLQAVPLHEATRGSTYQPPAWLVRVSHLHKKQSLDAPASKLHPTSTPPARNRGGAATFGARATPAPDRHALWPMKTFFVLVALSLALSALTGVYMGWRHARDRRRYGATLAAGVLVPVCLLLI